MSDVIVAMSGGVDSSVAALKLLQNKHSITGLFMKNWDEDDGTDACTATADLADAQQVCDKLKIELKTVNFASEYWQEVFSVFLQQLKLGHTPNPDILCNKHIKFKAFLHYAITDLGADYIATGHYARVGKVADEYQLLKGLDPTKEQSYFLYTLGQYALSKTLFPIGGIHKTQLRQLAHEAGFANHAKKDSTGICFIGERPFGEFLHRYLPTESGDIRTAEGDIIGKHQGLMYYTLGQRQGLGIGGVQNSAQGAWYVLDKNLSDNALLVGQDHDHPLLLHDTLLATQLDWCGKPPPNGSYHAKTRYRQSDQPCQLQHLPDNRCRVVFNQKQRAITPGQSVVFYAGDVCLGGGIIESKCNQ